MNKPPTTRTVLRSVILPSPPSAHRKRAPPCRRARALQHLVRPARLAQREALRDDRVQLAGRQTLEHHCQRLAVPGVGLRGVRRHGHLLAVGDEREQEPGQQALRDDLDPMPRCAGHPEPHEAPALAQGPVRTPQLPRPTDGVEDGIHPIAGEIADALDEVLGVIVDRRGPRADTSSCLCLDAVPYISSPASLPSSKRAVPTPPAAPWIRMRSPLLTPAARCSIPYAVT
jgi:hypothetical protein